MVHSHASIIHDHYIQTEMDLGFEMEEAGYEVSLEDLIELGFPLKYRFVPDDAIVIPNEEHKTAGVKIVSLITSLTGGIPSESVPFPAKKVARPEEPWKNEDSAGIFCTFRICNADSPLGHG